MPSSRSARNAPSADGPTPGSSADAVPDAVPADVAREICLQQLAASPKSRAQLETVLRRRGVDPDVAAEVLDRLEDVRLVDDTAFAESYVQTRRAASMSRRALGHELRAKGVAGEVVTEALGTLDPDAEAETARALVARRLPSTRAQPVDVRVRRLVGMLARKGYPGGLALRVVREALAAERELDELERALLESLDVDLSDAARLGE
ncbi:MAG: regulatory protein RecX [Actinomycetales bacterium]|nr:regulatory protein RecX [Actinomycetales bacterium]